MRIHTTDNDVVSTVIYEDHECMGRADGVLNIAQIVENCVVKLPNIISDAPRSGQFGIGLPVANCAF